VDGPILYYTLNFCLILLFVLHIYWWILILRVLIKQGWAASGDSRERTCALVSETRTALQGGPW